MSVIPDEPQLTAEQAWAELQKWYETRQASTAMNKAEKAMRSRVAGFYFPDPVLGVNRVPLNPGFELKLTAKRTYTVDEAALLKVTAEQVQALQLPMATLFVQKWSMSVAAYNDLNDEQRAFVDGLITITDATPSLEVVPAADAEGQARHVAAAEAVATATGKETKPKPARKPRATKAKAVEAAPKEEPAIAKLIHLGAEDTTPPGHYYRDAEGLWWLLKASGDEWLEITPEHAGGAGAVVLEEMEAYWQSLPASKRKQKG